MLRFIPFTRVSVPRRTVALVWRKTFPRLQAIAALYKTIEALSLYGCEPIRLPNVGNPEFEFLFREAAAQ